MFNTVGSTQGMFSDVAAQIAVVAVLLVAGVCVAGTTVEGVLAASVPVQVEVVQAPRHVTWAQMNVEQERAP